MVTAYIDESQSSGWYLIAAVLVDRRVEGDVRRGLRQLPQRHQQRVHMKANRPIRQRELLETFAALPIRCVVVRSKPDGAKGDERARAACLARVTDEVITLECSMLVVESRGNRTADTRDGQTIETARAKHTHRLEYRHDLASLEPLLWLPDGVAWAAGHGGPDSTRSPTPSSRSDR